MPFPALLLVIAALLPLAGCFALLAWGRRLGTPLAGYAATSFIIVSFLCSGWAMMRWVSGGKYQGAPYGQTVAPIAQTWAWLPIGAGGAHMGGLEQDHPGQLDFALYIDSLTVTLFVTITLAAMLVCIFTARSMRRDLRFVRFFILLSFACFSVLAMLLCGSLLHLVLMLEVVGFAASLLIGFRAEREPTARAAARMFMIGRIGDLGLLLGIGILICTAGNLTLPDLWMMLGGAAGGGGVVPAGGAAMSPGLLTAAGIALALGAAARCAQFPLHVWASDAAEGVAPAAATVLCLTLGLAGAYLIARIFPILTPSARLLIAIVGATTLLMAALVACAQPGIKQVLAWAALSQLGLIVLGIAIGSWAGGLLHLVAYVFFQILLFLAAGAVVRAARGETELSQFGGLAARMPVTAITSLLAILAACGAGAYGLGLSGYYSRGTILAHAATFSTLAAEAGRSRFYWALFICPVAGTLLTAFALMRWWLLIFAGRPRDRRLFDHAREVSTLFWPLVVLALLTALTGKWLGLGDMVASAIVEARQQVHLEAETSAVYRDAQVHVFDAAWPADEPLEAAPAQVLTPPAASMATSPSINARDRGSRLARRWMAIAAAAGILAGLLVYAFGPGLADGMAGVPPVSWVHAWLYHRMYFDELYEALFVTLALGMAGLAAWVDQNVIQGMTMLMAWSVGRLNWLAGGRLRRRRASRRGGYTSAAPRALADRLDDRHR